MARRSTTFPILLLAPLLATSLGFGCTKKTAEIDIGTVLETMVYDKTAFTVEAGQPVHVKLHNHATAAAMQHNWVLVRPGTEAAVAAAGVEAGPSLGYVAASPDILASTPLSNAGGTVEVTFTAPMAGTYPYICTFPAHFLTMKGVMTVTN